MVASAAALDFLAQVAPRGGVPAVPAPPAAPGRSPASQPRAPVALRQIGEQAANAFPAAAVPMPAAPSPDPAVMTVRQLLDLVGDPAVDWRTKASAFDEIEARKIGRAHV